MKKVKLLLTIFLGAALLSGCSNPLEEIPAAIPPSAPSELTATAGDAQVELSWEEVDGALNYHVYRWLSLTEEPVLITTTEMTGYTDSGLTNGTVYYYQVTAVNSDGESLPSIRQSATPQVSVPGIPSDLFASAGDASVTLSWSAVDGATGYGVYRSAISGVIGDRIASPSATTYVDTGLTNGTTYYYHITAINPGGESPAGAELNATPQLSIPGVPANLSAAAGDKVVILSWDEVPGALSYEVYCSLIPGETGSYAGYALTNSFTSINRVNETTYYYQISAANVAGESALSAQIGATPHLPVPASGPNLTVTPESGSVSLSWNTLYGAAGYRVYRSSSSGNAGIMVAEVIPQPLSQGSYRDTGLVNGTTYYYQVTAFNSGGESVPGIQMSATPRAGWQSLGNRGFSQGQALDVTLDFDSDGTPYVAYYDAALGSKATVMKLQGDSWTPVGSAGFSPGQAYYLSLDIDSAGTPYISYADFANGGRVSVEKFNGTDWVQVGTAGFAGGTALETCIAFDSIDTPYISFSNTEIGYSATVMKFDGTSWVQVGEAKISSGQGRDSSLVFDSEDNPYIAYVDSSNENKISMNMFNGTSWEQVGTAGFTAGEAEFPGLSIDSDGMLYVAYKDNANGGKASVMRYAGTIWEQVGTAGFSDGELNGISLSLSSDGTPYVSFSDKAVDGSLSVMKFNGAAWELVGDGAFTATYSYSSSLAFDYEDVLHMAFEDYGYSYRASVMVFQ